MKLKKATPFWGGFFYDLKVDIDVFCIHFATKLVIFDIAKIITHPEEKHINLAKEAPKSDTNNRYKYGTPNRCKAANKATA